MKRRFVVIVFAFLALLFTPDSIHSVAASDGDSPQVSAHKAGHSAHSSANDSSKKYSGKKSAKRTCKNPAIAEYIRANDEMHRNMNIEYSGNADIDFVTGMIPHHQGAIDMAKVQLKYGKDEKLKQLARNIIIWQEAEIGLMKQWLEGRRSAWKASNVSSLDSVRSYISAMDKMHHAMHIEYSGDADVDFARGMIPHHQGAIDMASVLKTHGSSLALRFLIHDIIRSQGQEIRLMQSWLKEKGGV